MIPVVRRKRVNEEPTIDRRTAWREVAALLRGELVEGKRPSGDKLGVPHGPWSIWLDTYALNTGQINVIYTRVRAYFVGWRGLTLKVRERNFLDRIREVLGYGNRPAVSRSLLEKYVVKGKPEARLPSLFMASGLTAAILDVPSVTLQVRRPSRSLRKRYGESLGVVYCQTTGVVGDVTRLAGMIRVVAAALDALAGVGEAHRQGVTVR